MSTILSLDKIQKGRCYKVSGFEKENSKYAEKLYKMGFVIGTPVELAPVQLTDPMVVQIRGSRIALRRAEAREVLVVEF